MRIMDATVFSGFARRTAEQASDYAGVVRNLILDVRDCYRPGVARPAWARAAPAVAGVCAPSRRGKPYSVAGRRF
jgi:hypothetical protein